MRVQLPVKPFKMYKTWFGRLLFIVACVFGTIMALCWLFNMLWWGAEVLPGLVYGMPQNERPSITQRKLIPPGRLTDIAVNDDSVFLLYASAGIVNVYSHEGEMMYSIYFPDQSNGSASLYASGSDLYYCNRWDNIWHIQDGAYRQYWEYTKEMERIEVLRARYPSHQDTICLYEDLRYEIRGQDVFCVQPDGTEQQFIDGLDILARLEFTSLWFIGFYSFVAVLVAFVVAAKVEETNCKRHKNA